MNIVKCAVGGCEREQYKVGMCRGHIARAIWDRKNEKWKAIYKAAFKHNNRIYLENDYAVMVIVNRAEKESFIFINVEDISMVQKYKWSQDNKGYAVARINGRNIRLHRYLMQLPEGVLGDHKDGNRLDNRRKNIRPCTPLENSRNRGKSINNKSGVPGVQWVRQRNKWVAIIGLNRSTKHLGYFDSFEDAVRARKEAERQYFGEFARIN